jgi:hypothetical protein
VSEHGDVELPLEDIVAFRRSGEPTLSLRTCARLRRARASAGPWLVVPVDDLDARAIESGAEPGDPVAAILPLAGTPGRSAPRLGRTRRMDGGIGARQRDG